MTARPKLRDSPGEFETPAMDSGQRFVRITLKTMPVHGFDHRANWEAKVRNVSRLGSQLFLFQISAIRLIPLCALKRFFLNPPSGS